MAGMVGLMFALAQSGGHRSGSFHPAKTGSVGNAIEALAPTAAGQPSSLTTAPAEAQRPEVYLGGKLATGRVAEVYVRVADNVFLALDRAPEHLKNSAERWVDVQFPELLANDTGAARAFLNRSDSKVAVGDIVEIKFAHKDNPRYFPVKELTRVTELVASKDQMLARDYQRRILARTGQGNAGPQWLSQAAAQASTGGQPTTVADAKH
jgi:hypothetical protein